MATKVCRFCARTWPIRPPRASGVIVFSCGKCLEEQRLAAGVPPPSPPPAVAPGKPAPHGSPRGISLPAWRNGRR